MIPVKMKRFKRPPQCRSRYDGGPLYAEVQDFLRRKPHFDNLERYLFNSPERLSSKKPRHLVSDSLPGCYWFVPSPNQIGRASCRERVEILVVAVHLKEKGEKRGG